MALKHTSLASLFGINLRKCVTWCIRAAVLPTALIFAPLQAQEQPRQDDHDGILTLSLENDLFSGEDDNYTNGVRLAVLSAENNLPKWIEEGASAFPLFAREGHKRWSFSLGQSIFTPEDITVRELQREDRPYAGWLYGSFGVTSDTGSRLDNLQLTLGVVGPPSGAEQTQKFFHDVFYDSLHTRHPLGWHDQLDTEPGLVLEYERKWRKLHEFSPFGFGMDITPSIGGAVGNIYTHASVGAVARLGYDLPSDYGPPLIRPSLPGSDFFIPTQDFGWYLFAGVEGRAVARNIFLDGNTFSDSHSVDKRPFIGNLQTGIAFTYDDMRFAYTHIFYTEEFHGQRGGDAFGAFTVSWRL